MARKFRDRIAHDTPYRGLHSDVLGSRGTYMALTDALRAEPPCVKTLSACRLATKHVYTYIEAEPANPNQSRSQEDDSDVVSFLMGLLSTVVPLT